MIERIEGLTDSERAARAFDKTVSGIEKWILGIGAIVILSTVGLIILGVWKLVELVWS